jgi:hypothetical protein
VREGEADAQGGEVIHYKPVTWDGVKALLKERGVAMSNRQIADALDADRQDVSNLTALMTKAGELRARHVKEKTTQRNFIRLYELTENA